MRQLIPCLLAFVFCVPLSSANQQKAEKKLSETQARYQKLASEMQRVKEAIRQAFMNTQLVSQKIAQAHAENKRGVEAINRLKVEIPRVEAELPHTCVSTRAA